MSESVVPSPVNLCRCGHDALSHAFRADRERMVCIGNRNLCACSEFDIADPSPPVGLGEADATLSVGSEALLRVTITSIRGGQVGIQFGQWVSQGSSPLGGVVSRAGITTTDELEKETR